MTDSKTCPYCAEAIAVTATRCPLCNTDLVPAAPPTQAPPTPAPAAPRPASNQGWDQDWFMLVGIIGLIVSGVAAALFFDSDPALAVIIMSAGGGIASIYLLIGIIAKGVEVGMRAHR